MKPLVITIDGPAGAGKTTVSKYLAQRLGYRYVDTGALYRGVALEALIQGIDSEDEKGLAKVCRHLKLRLLPAENGTRLYSGHTDISEQIRTPRITMMASAVSAKKVVRDYLLQVQRRLGEEKSVVFEGRDMGTVVFPDADVKFFLYASDHVRAKRRYEELKGKTNQSLRDVENDMQKRDANDSSRDIAPLKPASDAFRIDATDLSIESVVEAMLVHVKRVLSM